ncbi:MAG: antibiotic biosynthesis monooxygenase [Actinobacteria bacterium]|nr:antibiotic biosynthesis monooxygenase [Actinomycetota bacterium]
MIIVSGWLRVKEGQRQRYLAASRPVIEAARSAPGCVDFHLSADPLEDDRVNVFESWEDVESVERFRGSGPSDDQQGDIVGAQVHQHHVASSIPLS